MYGGGTQGPQDGGGWHGHPPPGGYGAPPGFPPPPAPPRRSSRAPVVVAAAVLLVIVLGGGVGVALMRSRSHDGPSPVVTLSSPRSAQPSVAPSRPPAQARIPGWHAVAAVKHGVSYDAPPTWSVKSPDTIVGFEDAHGSPQVGGSGAATFRDGYCKGHSASWRAETAVTGYSTPDLAADAKDAAYKWATYGYEPSKGGPPPVVTLGAPQAVNAGGSPGQEVTANVTVRDRSDPCSPPTAIAHAVAIAVQGKVSVLIVIADQGVSDAAPDSDLQKIAGSLRPSA